MKTDFTELLEARICSACGRVHGSEVKRIVMGEGVLGELPAVIRERGDYRHAVMICDENTYAAAGRTVEGLWAFDRVIVLPPENLHANEHGVALVRERLTGNADLLVAVGSGTVHDITRYVAYHRGIPFVSVPTAASVDGYVSNVAAMTLEGTKKTVVACAPIAMVADIDVIADAPMRLTASGVGDMLGKFTALTDWKVAHLLTGEYYCTHVVSLMEQALDSVISSIDRLQDRDHEAIASLTYGLILSGVAMQHVGVSRPASGAEHHISHFIEVTMPDRCDALHGEKVGVGMVLVSQLYHRFAALSDAQIAEKLQACHTPSDGEWKQIFGDLWEVLKRENTPDCAETVDRDAILAKLPEIRELIAALPDAEQLTDYLMRCGACHTLEDIGLPSAELLPGMYKTAPLIRNRLTLMRLLRQMEL
ncbi:MAG: sn-glycerol-1-phosphate dehydrogenase [Clostridia bacterium]|nr:sn-glycerol-1-phosphate dehydrogenase [Clostridia bacterium]